MTEKIYNNNTTFPRRKKQFNWWVFLYAMGALFCFYPYEFYTFYLTFLPDKPYITASVFCVVTILFLFIVAGKVKGFTKGFLFVVLVQLFGYYSVALMHTNLMPAIGITPSILLALLLLLVIENTMGVCEFFKRYNHWILIMAILGVATWALVTFWGFSAISVVEDRADGRMIANYGLTFSKFKEFLDLGALRYGGFFDEAGAMAYWGIFALVFNKLFIKSRRFEILLSVLLILTFSIGYYIQLIVYYALFSLGKVKPVHIITSFFVIGLVVFGLYSAKDTALNAVYEMTFNRVQAYSEQAEDNGGTLEVGNRAVLTENAKKIFLNNKLFGADLGEDAEAGNNIYEPLAQYGIIGTLFVYFPFIFMLYFGFKSKNKEIWKCALVLIIGCLHRPFHSNLLSFFIIYSLILMCVQANKQRKAVVLK